MTALLTLLTVLAADAPAAREIPCNRTWERLHPASSDAELRQAVAEAGTQLGPWSITFTGIALDGAALQKVAATDPQQPFVRVLRETLKRPIDLEDFVFFLDDLLEAGTTGLRGQPVWLGTGRARAAGILLHPDDVFKDVPRRYGEVAQRLNIDEPEEQSNLVPATDGEPLGPRWTARFQNPEKEQERVAVLVRRSPDFAARLQHLLGQLREQGVEVRLTSTLRSRKRGYLMWGSFVLSQAGSRKQLNKAVQMLRRTNKRWNHNVPIKWRAPGGWQPTVEAARQMKETYDVVYATRRGARFSDHYDGKAIDLVALALPRTLTLTAPDGATQRFDLSDPNESRDLSLTVPVIEWLEEHYRFRKLRSDYPHWVDAAARTPAAAKRP